MAQIDIESALPGIQVLVVRPIALDFTGFARALVELVGRDKITTDDLRRFSDESGTLSAEVTKSLNPVFAPLDFLSNIPLNLLAQWMNSIQQLAYCNFSLQETSDRPSKHFIIEVSAGWRY
jgi:hypothetical protein